MPHLAWLGNGWLDSKHLALFAQGLLTTLTLSLFVILAGTLLGLMLGVLLARRERWLLPLHGLHAVFRNTPLLVQLLLWYFGIGSLLPEEWMIWLNTPHTAEIGPIALNWPSFEILAAWAALSLYAMAFIAQDIRSGLNAVPRGQWEAARAQGLSEWQTLRWVILPQALRVAWPPLLGQYLNTIKNTSLAMAIGVMELSYRARQVEAETLLTFQAFAVATLAYVLIILALQFRQQPAYQLENKR